MRIAVLASDGPEVVGEGVGTAQGDVCMLPRVPGGIEERVWRTSFAAAAHHEVCQGSHAGGHHVGVATCVLAAVEYATVRDEMRFAQNSRSSGETKQTGEPTRLAGEGDRRDAKRSQRDPDARKLRRDDGLCVGDGVGEETLSRAQSFQLC